MFFQKGKKFSKLTPGVYVVEVDSDNTHPTAHPPSPAGRGQKVHKVVENDLLEKRSSNPVSIRCLFLFLQGLSELHNAQHFENQSEKVSSKRPRT
jgi:hypothetical protein